MHENNDLSHETARRMVRCHSSKYIIPQNYPLIRPFQIFRSVKGFTRLRKDGRPLLHCLFASASSTPACLVHLHTGSIKDFFGHYLERLQRLSCVLNVQQLTLICVSNIDCRLRVRIQIWKVLIIQYLFR